MSIVCTFMPTSSDSIHHFVMIPCTLRVIKYEIAQAFSSGEGGSHRGGRSSYAFLLLPKSLNRLFSVIPSGKSIISGYR